MKKVIAGEKVPNSPGNKTFTGDNLCLLPKNGAGICQDEVIPDTDIGDTLTDKLSFKFDFRLEKTRAEYNAARSTRRCPLCQALCGVGSFDVHIHFCRLENPVKTRDEQYPPSLKKIIRNKKNGVNHEKTP